MTRLLGLPLFLALGFAGAFAIGWFLRPRPSILLAARGRNLDRLALSLFGERREGWREKLPVLGDRRFRRRLRSVRGPTWTGSGLEPAAETTPTAPAGRN